MEASLERERGNVLNLVRSALTEMAAIKNLVYLSLKLKMCSSQIYIIVSLCRLIDHVMNGDCRKLSPQPLLPSLY